MFSRCSPNSTPADSISARAVPRSAPSSGPRAKVAPLSSDRFLLRVTLSAETHAKLRCAQQLMGHIAPGSDPAVVIDKALSLLVAQLERAKIARVCRPRAKSPQSSSPSSGSRHIPASIRRQVWARDEGRCAFAGALDRCTETSRLEFHHLIPFARGGPTTFENVALRCRAHNSYESQQLFGPWSVSEA
jgi:5-methylcytosine-specific restriction endonuclease McrA